MIGVHAPTEDKEEIVKDVFYRGLEKVYKDSPKHCKDVKIVFGGFKFKTGTVISVQTNNMYAQQTK